jgi:uncharacterized OB-fold protein
VTGPAGDLPVAIPAVMLESQPFWDGLAARQLRLQRCGDCDAVVWYPRGLCPRCGSLNLAWFTASGQGVVYSYTVVRRTAGPFAAATPYVVAYVELAEGPRVLTNVVGCEPERVSIGQRVECVFDTGEQGRALLRFRPAPDAAAS